MTSTMTPIADTTLENHIYVIYLPSEFHPERETNQEAFMTPYAFADSWEVAERLYRKFVPRSTADRTVMDYIVCVPILTSDADTRAYLNERLVS